MANPFPRCSYTWVPYYWLSLKSRTLGCVRQWFRPPFQDRVDARLRWNPRLSRTGDVLDGGYRGWVEKPGPAIRRASMPDHRRVDGELGQVVRKPAGSSRWYSSVGGGMRSGMDRPGLASRPWLLQPNPAVHSWGPSMDRGLEETGEP